MCPSSMAPRMFPSSPNLNTPNLALHRYPSPLHDAHTLLQVICMPPLTAPARQKLHSTSMSASNSRAPGLASAWLALWAQICREKHCRVFCCLLCGRKLAACESGETFSFGIRSLKAGMDRNIGFEKESLVRWGGGIRA